MFDNKKSMMEKEYVSTRNACKVCTPLGASIAFKGVEGAMALIHGSQGCSTYIRRYLISHYKEPVDIASTNFTEESAVFGGEANLIKAINNMCAQYKPKIICIATTCLSETIGDDMNKIISKYQSENSHKEDLPQLVYVNTPSFKGTHANGFHDAVLFLVKHFSEKGKTKQAINFFPGFLSTSDLRHLKEIISAFGIEMNFLPDYSDTLDYGYTGEYEKIPNGGTPIANIVATGSAKASIEFGYIINRGNNSNQSAGQFLEKAFSVPCVSLNTPIGIKATDEFFKVLEKLSDKPTPEKYKKQRGRLIDAYVDGHKYVFGKKAVVYGEEDLVIPVIAFLEEIGIETVLCASGGNSGLLKKVIKEKINPQNDIDVHDNYDFEDIAKLCKSIKPDLLIGNSKGYYIARELQVPLVRIGFPIHDRMGGQRIKHIGYEGSMELFDRIANALIEFKQDNSSIGYKYM